MKNLGLYFTQEDYLALAGPDWPSYDQYLSGDRSNIPEIQDELENYTKMFVDDGIKFPVNNKTAGQSK